MRTPIQRAGDVGTADRTTPLVRGVSRLLIGRLVVPRCSGASLVGTSRGTRGHRGHSSGIRSGEMLHRVVWRVLLQLSGGGGGGGE